MNNKIAIKKHAQDVSCIKNSAKVDIITIYIFSRSALL